MICPYCQTDNRDDREACYYCEKDLTMLRLIVNKAKHHYNQALEFAERGHSQEAIAELKNTLDLDGTMVNAQVVLGTLYAKQEQFEEARACWNRALEIDHRYLKAHEYLEKARNAEYVYPGMRRMLRLCAMLGLALAGAIVAALFFAVPDPGLRLIHEAGSLIGGKDMRSAEARERLSAITERTDVSEQVDETARYFGAAIEAQWRDLLELAEAALRDGQPMFALNTLDKLEAQRPSQQVKEEAAKYRDHAVAALSERVRAAADAFYQNQGGYETFRAQAQVLLSHAREGEARQAIQHLFDSVTKENAQRQLAQARVAVGEAPLSEAIERAAEFENRNPDIAGEIRDLLDQRLAAESSRIQARARDAIEAGDWDAATTQTESIRVLFAQAGRPAPDQDLAALQGELKSAQAAAARAAAQKLFDSGKWEAFLDATADTTTLARDEAGAAALDTQRTEALRKWAAAEWTWFEKNDGRFESGRISADDAARAVRNYERVLENLPKRLGFARGPVVFYAAAAHYKLGQVDKTKELLQRVRTEYPKSYIIKNSMGSFIERHPELGE